MFFICSGISDHFARKGRRIVCFRLLNPPVLLAQNGTEKKKLQFPFGLPRYVVKLGVLCHAEGTSVLEIMDVNV